MLTKHLEKEKAIAMRREGKTYSEILKVVPVAKSTISLWLKEVGLSVPQKQHITQARLDAAKRGGLAKKNARIKLQTTIISEASKEIGNISKRELFLIGVILYWAEGSKEKEWRPGTKLVFSNMDPRIIQLFLRWLIEIAKTPKDMIGFEIYLHETHKIRISEIVSYWAGVTGFPEEYFSKIYFKKTKILKTKRHNTGEAYFGVLRITVKQSSTLVRKIAGWSEGISYVMN